MFGLFAGASCRPDAAPAAGRATSGCSPGRAPPTAGAVRGRDQPRGCGCPAGDRLGWHEIHKATWAGAAADRHARRRWSSQARRVRRDGRRRPGAWSAWPTPDDVPAEVRTRVTRSVAYTAHHPLPGGGVRVVGRRVPGRERASTGTCATTTAPTPPTPRWWPPPTSWWGSIRAAARVAGTHRRASLARETPADDYLHWTVLVLLMPVGPVGQQPVAGWRKPGYGFRSPMSVYRPTLVDGVCVGCEIVFGAVRMNHGRKTSSSGW